MPLQEHMKLEGKVLGVQGGLKEKGMDLIQTHYTHVNTTQNTEVAQ